MNDALRKVETENINIGLSIQLTVNWPVWMGALKSKKIETINSKKIFFSHLESTLYIFYRKLMFQLNMT